MKISKKISERLKKNNIPFLANDSIAKHISVKERKEIQAEVEEAFQSVLDALVIDTENDHNTKETAQRVAKMYVNEVFKGRYFKAPKVTDFPNAKQLNELYTIGPITIRSACSHHFVPIMGEAWIGIVPSERVIGLSKFNRLADWIMSRPHIQEEAVVMLADTIEKMVKPEGIAVVVRAKHYCMTWRGVKDNSTMTNAVMRGIFMDKPHLKSEFYETIKAQEF